MKNFLKNCFADFIASIILNRRVQRAIDLRTEDEDEERRKRGSGDGEMDRAMAQMDAAFEEDPGENLPVMIRKSVERMMYLLAEQGKIPKANWILSIEDTQYGIAIGVMDAERKGEQ